MASDPDRTTELTPSWMASIVLWWDETGAAHELAGPEAVALPGTGTAPVHVLTSQDPLGVEQPAARNRELLRELLAWVVDETAGASAGWAWWPATGMAVDSGHAEQGIALRGASRADAVALGRRYEQLGIYEVTDDDIAVVRCDDGEVSAVGPRRWAMPPDGTAERLAQERAAAWWRTYVDLLAEVRGPG